MGKDVEAYAGKVERELNKIHAAHGGQVAPIFARIERPPVTWKRHEGTGRKGRTPTETRVEKQVIHTILGAARQQWEQRTGEEWPKQAWYRVAIYACIDYFGRGDVDNFAKLVLDAAKGVLWSDDKRVVSLSVDKCLHTHMHWVVSAHVITAAKTKGEP